MVHDADGVDDDTMGAFARETRLSETTFVQTPTKEGADYRNRIWTVAGEVPFAGHPSLGTAVAFAESQGPPRAPSSSRRRRACSRSTCGATGDAWTASMLQGPATFGAEAEAPHVMAAAGLLPGNAHREWMPQTVSTGLPTLIAPVRSERRDRKRSARLRPGDVAARDRAGAQTLYLAWYDGDGARACADVQPAAAGRGGPGHRIGGRTAVRLSARAGVTSRVEISQGVEIGRPSTLVAEIEGDRVRVSGGVVAVIRGEVLL